MTIATFPIIVFSVLASELIDTFDVTRAQIGFLVTATGLVGALVSPLFGRVTDRIGSVAATRAVLSVGVLTLIGVSLAPTYAVLFAASLATGVPNGWSNPATNSLIVDTLPLGERGVVTGIKQSGVQIGTFLGGLFLPLLTGLWDWRFAVAAFLVIPVIALVGMSGRPETEERMSRPRGAKRPVPKSVRWVALYGAISGLATSAIFGFLPLFAEESQGWAPTAAGSLLAAVGLIGIIGRVVWPLFAERRVGHGRVLQLLAILTLTSATLLALAGLGVIGSGWLVPAAVLLGLGGIAWNAVGMLAVMDFSPHDMVGKSTGLVLLGFLMGIAIGAPVMGWSVDAMGTYAPGFFVIGGLMMLDVFVAAKIPATGNVAVS